MGRRGTLALVAALMALGCAAEPDPASTTSGDAGLVVEMDDIFFSPSRIEVPAGDAVTVRLTNVGGIVHDLVLDDGWMSGDVTPGASTTVELGPFDESTTGWCSIPGHRDAGMELEIVVTAPAS